MSSPVLQGTDLTTQCDCIGFPRCDCVAPSRALRCFGGLRFGAAVQNPHKINAVAWCSGSSGERGGGLAGLRNGGETRGRASGATFLTLIASSSADVITLDE